MPNLVVLPNLVGMEYGLAKKTITSLNLNWVHAGGETEIPEPTVIKPPSETVTYEIHIENYDPKEGLSEGDTVSLTTKRIMIPPSSPDFDKGM